MAPPLNKRQQEVMARVLRECDSVDDAELLLTELEDAERTELVETLIALGVPRRRHRKTIDLRRGG